MALLFKLGRLPKTITGILHRGMAKKHERRVWRPTPGMPAEEDDPRTPEEVVASIDTTLTPEQQAYVETLKKKMKGAGPRSPYRDIPLLEELQPNSPFPPYIPDNAQQLIDFALSHVPKRAGPRGTRKKKRMAKRFAFKNVPLQSALRAIDS